MNVCDESIWIWIRRGFGKKTEEESFGWGAETLEAVCGSRVMEAFFYADPSTHSAGTSVGVRVLVCVESMPHT